MPNSVAGTDGIAISELDRSANTFARYLRDTLKKTVHIIILSRFLFKHYLKQIDLSDRYLNVVLYNAIEQGRKADPGI